MKEKSNVNMRMLGHFYFIKWFRSLRFYPDSFPGFLGSSEFFFSLYSCTCIPYSFVAALPR